jgi:beta-galactosidase
MAMKTIVPLAAALITAAAAHAEPGPRVHENFNRGWMFARQATGSGMLGSFDRDTSEASRIEPRFQNAFRAVYDDSSWQKIDLPHTWNAHDSMDEVSGYWRGIGWYRKHFTLDQKYAGKRVFLEFEGVNLVAEVWVNGARLGVHSSGYTGFEYEITAAARFGTADNVVTVKVDNLYHDEIPPTVKTDYTFYGGIYRDVWLRITEPVYVASMNWATPSVNEQKASLQLHSVVRNAGAAPRQLTLRQEVIDPHGKTVASLSRNAAATAAASIDLDQATEIASPELWAPDTPNVYTVRSTLLEGQHVVDVSEAPLGFRWFKFDAQKGFFLNGKRVQIQGVNWHQSYPGMGDALPNSRHWKDMQAIRELGANFWRTSHYPHDPATMEASDHLGLMVWEELPVNKEIGHPDAYIRNVVLMAREMIARDRNHPSVILWGIAGEVNAPQQLVHRVIETAANEYRSLDPSRPVVMHEPRGEDIEALVDVVGAGAGRATDEKHARFPERPYMTGEYSAALIGRGIYGGGTGSEESGCERHEQALRQINRRAWMAGGAIWNAFDYDGESYDPIVPHMVSFGVADIWRIPKEVYYFYQSQWSAQPMVHIVGHWTWPGEEGHERPVKVYSNAAEVELFLNGRSLGVKSGAPADGLAHPPLVWKIEYQPGTLRAVAHFEKSQTTDERKTAGPPAQILLTSDSASLVSGDPESLAYLTATIADKAGTPVPNSALPVAFTWYGPGELLPQTWPGHATGLTWNVIGGMTRIAFRSTNRSGRAVVSAYSPGLSMGRTSILVTAPGKPNEMDYKERFSEDETPVTGKVK